jgi:pSer/pThr/pTyr-binding forkhead associated (FHA) protein
MAAGGGCILPRAALQVTSRRDWQEADTRVEATRAQLSLIGEAGPLRGQVFGSEGKTITIGRDETCAIVLPVAEASRKNSRIEYRAGRFWLSDLGSLNGTRLNQRLIGEPAALEEHDLVDVCGQIFRVALVALEGRRLVEDRPSASEPIPVAVEGPGLVTAPGASGLGAPASLRPWIIVGLIAVAATGMVGFFAARRMRANEQAARLAPSPPAPTAPSTPPSPTRRSARARLEALNAVALVADADITITKVPARGATVQRGEVVVQYRKARANGVLRAPIAGVVVDAQVQAGARLHTGDEVLRIAEQVRIVTDETALEGMGEACEVERLDAAGAPIRARRLVPEEGTTRVLVVDRMPDGVALGDLGPVHVSCPRP